MPVRDALITNVHSTIHHRRRENVTSSKQIVRTSRYGVLHPLAKFATWRTSCRELLSSLWRCRPRRAHAKVWYLCTRSIATKEATVLPAAGAPSSEFCNNKWVKNKSSLFRETVKELATRSNNTYNDSYTIHSSDLSTSMRQVSSKTQMIFRPTRPILPRSPSAQTNRNMQIGFLPQGWIVNHQSCARTKHTRHVYLITIGLRTNDGRLVNLRLLSRDGTVESVIRNPGSPAYSVNSNCVVD